ncbi:hypothetical protein TH9_05720 [Thalassospira xiamenensis]|nr:hypothetical protein TH9_05720 [Thalassospira xiamenensis]
MNHGMSRRNGAKLTKREHIGQSVEDILNTPVGTRIKRRQYGSHVFDLVDSPGNATGALQMIAATADAIERWEPRLILKNASVSVSANGQAQVSISGHIKDDGEAVAYAIKVGGAS